MWWSSGTLSHTGHDSVLLKSPVGFTVAPVSQVSCLESRGAPALSLLRGGSPEVALAKTTRGKEQGVGRGRETERKLLVTLCRRATS